MSAGQKRSLFGLMSLRGVSVFPQMSWSRKYRLLCDSIFSNLYSGQSHCRPRARNTSRMSLIDANSHVYAIFTCWQVLRGGRKLEHSEVWRQ